VSILANNNESSSLWSYLKPVNNFFWPSSACFTLFISSVSLHRGNIWQHVSHTIRIVIEIFTFVLCILVLSKFYLFTNWCTSELSEKNNIKIYIKIYIRTAPACFSVTVTPSSGSTL